MLLFPKDPSEQSFNSKSKIKRLIAKHKVILRKRNHNTDLIKIDEPPKRPDSLSYWALNSKNNDINIKMRVGEGNNVIWEVSFKASQDAFPKLTHSQLADGYNHPPLLKSTNVFFPEPSITETVGEKLLKFTAKGKAKVRFEDHLGNEISVGEVTINGTVNLKTRAISASWTITNTDPKDYGESANFSRRNGISRIEFYYHGTVELDVE